MPRSLVQHLESVKGGRSVAALNEMERVTWPKGLLSFYVWVYPGGGHVSVLSFETEMKSSRWQAKLSSIFRSEKPVTFVTD